MLEGKKELTLSELNEATIAWIEFEYHKKYHSEIGCTPLERYLSGTDVGRDCPDTQSLRQEFCMEEKRRQRKSDGTISLCGKRFEVPNQYRHLEVLHVQYARWDLSHVKMAAPNTHQLLCTLYPQDKLENAKGLRRANFTDEQTQVTQKSSEIAPLLKDLMAQYSATGLPPAYLPKEENE